MPEQHNSVTRVGRYSGILIGALVIGAALLSEPRGVLMLVGYLLGAFVSEVLHSE